MDEIKETGIRGFLKWLQVAQPAVYAKAAPQIAKNIPAAFSDYHAGGWRTAGLSPSQAVDKLNGLGIGPEAIQLDSLSFDTSSVSAPKPVDVSTAANAGDASTSTTDLIGGIVKGVSSLWMTKQQVDIQNKVVNTQLARAAAGLPPMNVDLSQYGVPRVSVGLSTGTGTALGIGAAIVAAIFFLPRLMGGRARR